MSERSPNEYENAIQSISRLILKHRRQAAGEEHAPTRTADAMDHYITTHRGAVTRLRRVREELEEIQAVKDYLEP